MIQRQILLWVCCLTLATLSIPVRGSDPKEAESIVVAGTGDSQDLLRRLARHLERQIGPASIDIPDSVGSSGGIKALIRGKVDLARVARPLKDDERQQNLAYRLFAQSPVVCVVHPSVKGIESISAREIVGIYSGQIKRWEDLGASPGKVYAVAREPGDSSFSVMGKHIPGLAAITKPRAKVIFTTPETVEVLESHAGTIGFLPMALARASSLRILPIDDMTATEESVLNGNYPFGIVYRGELTGLARAFVEFLTSPECQKIIRTTGAVPVGNITSPPAAAERNGPDS